METYQIIKEMLYFILYILSALGVGKLLLIILLKKLFPNASIKQIESFIKNTKTIYFGKKRNEYDKS